jgi:hypothetical protein
VGALVIGAILGAVVERVRFRAAYQFAPMLEFCRIGAFSGYVEGQKRFGTLEAYEQALKDLLRDLEDRNKSSSELIPHEMRLYDEALTYARLSDVQALRGATQESEQSLRNAEALCPAVKWKDCSGNKILEFVRRLDSHLDAKWDGSDAHHGR